jgi:hypothetical protein
LPGGRFEVIAPGVASELITFTLRLVLAELPQPLIAFTEMVPEPVLPVTIVLILLVVDVPLQPLGSVQT